MTIPPHGPWTLGAFLIALTVGTPALPAQAAAPAPLPTAEFRALAGSAFGLLWAGSFVNHRLRIETGAHRWTEQPIYWGEGAVLMRALGPAAHALWIRAGYQLTGADVGCAADGGPARDVAQTVDLGLSYRHRFAKGHLITSDFGVEALHRESGFYCKDSTLAGDSAGVRALVTGQLAVGRGFSVLARAGLRTASHLLELGVLPEVNLGIAYEF